MKIIGPFKQIITLENLPERGSLSDNQLRIYSDAGLLIDGETIVEVADFDVLRKNNKKSDIEEITTPLVALPGLIDCHTHICFAGDRSADFGMRLNGQTYLEIAEAGGGIWRTVTATRQASSNELAHDIVQRAEKMLKRGITTIEVKSGYGLDLPSELNMLRAIDQANKNTSADLVPTFLGAHMLPKDFEGSSEEYLHFLIQEVVPIIKKERLAKRADIFIEKTAFSVQESVPYLEKLNQLGFDLTVHADQFTSGGSAVAVQVGARSADHLEASGEKEIKLLAMSETVAVALPGASIGLGEPFTPAREILNKNGKLAIASDWNPGSAPMGDLLTQASILATYEKLSTAEVFAGICFRAAAALGKNQIGRLQKGFRADIAAFPTPTFRDILYNQGQMQPSAVWKNGNKT